MKKLFQNPKNEIRDELIDDFQNKEYAHIFVNSFLNTSIATQIKVLRDERGWTQKILAEKAEMKQPRISVLEDVYYSNWSIKTLQKLAEAFDVTLVVSFEKFSDRIGDIVSISRESLQRPSRMEDLVIEKDTIPIDMATNNVYPLFAPAQSNDKVEELPMASGE